MFILSEYVRIINGPFVQKFFIPRRWDGGIICAHLAWIDRQRGLCLVRLEVCHTADWLFYYLKIKEHKSLAEDNMWSRFDKESWNGGGNGIHGRLYIIRCTDGWMASREDDAPPFTEVALNKNMNKRLRY